MSDDEIEDFLPQPKLKVQLNLKASLPKPVSPSPVAAVPPSMRNNAFAIFRCTAANGSSGSAASMRQPPTNEPAANGNAEVIGGTKHSASNAILSEEESPSPLIRQRKRPPQRLGRISDELTFKSRPATRSPTREMTASMAEQNWALVEPQRRMVLEESDEDSPKAPPKRSKPVTESPAARSGPVAESPINLADDSPAQPGVRSEPLCQTPIAIDLSADDDENVPDSPEEKFGPLEKCELIASRIRSALADQTSSSQAAEDGSPAGSLAVVSGEQIAEACGGAAAQLKSYQLVGVNFMLLLKRLRVSGCILADEMGLGKTAQASCFLGALKGIERDAGPHLVIAPASLLENWQRELATWCPKLTVATFHGASRDDMRAYIDGWRRESRRAEAEGSARVPLPFDVCLVTYSAFERDGADQLIDRKRLSWVPWSHVILDEAHAVKRRNTSRAVKLSRLSSAAKRRIFLTGTPLQNDLKELNALLCLLLPDIFGSDTRQLDVLEESMDEADLAVRMRSLLSTFLLRRMKSQVASQLVAKKQVERHVEMTPTQAALYQSSIQRFKAEAQGAPSSSGSAAKERSPDEAAKQLGSKKVGNIFAHLRKIAQHPLLVRSCYSDAALDEIAKVAHGRGDFGDTAILERVRQELDSYSDHSLHLFCSASQNKRLRAMALSVEKMRESAKFELLSSLLPSLRQGGHRVLLFSQWTTCLDLLEWLLTDLDLKYVRLDGSTAVADRLSIVDSFNRDPSIFAFCLSTRAGGQGLNLTGADTVILHDCDFNPQIDRQAEDRSHRLGQERPVTVYRLVTQGSVDANILSIAQRKLRLDAAVLSGIGEGDETADKTTGAAAETRYMASILQAILADRGSTTQQAAQ